MSEKSNVGSAFEALAELPADLKGIKEELREVRAEMAQLRERIPPAMVAPKDAATALGVSLSTIRRMLARGELPSVRVGGQVRIDLSKVCIDGAAVATAARKARGE